MIRVMLADDEDMIRHALAALLSLEPDIDVVGQAADGRTAIETAQRHRPQVAVIDLEMPGLDGFQVTTELGRLLPDCAVVMLTGRGRPNHLERALRAGAKAFVPKGAPGQTLAEVIRRVNHGERYVDPALAAEALTAPVCPLSTRELDVLRLAAFDLSTTVIARRTHLAGGTVRNYLASAQAKLGAANRSEAIRLAQHFDWI